MTGLIRTFLVSTLLFGGTFWMSQDYIGYDKAGKAYITKQREERKSRSVRVGSPGDYGSRGFRAGQ